MSRRKKFKIKSISKNASEKLPKDEEVKLLNNNKFKNWKTALFSFITIVCTIIGTLALFRPDIFDLSKPKLTFKLDRGQSAFLLDDNSLYYSYLLRGTVYNEGLKPLNLREYAVSFKYDNKVDNLTTAVMPDSILIRDIRHDSLNKLYYRKDLNFLESKDQLEPGGSYNGWIYCIYPRQLLNKYQFANAMLDSSIIGLLKCRDIHGELYEFPFSYYIIAPEELRPEDK